MNLSGYDEVVLYDFNVISCNKNVIKLNINKIRFFTSKDVCIRTFDSCLFLNNVKILSMKCEFYNKNRA